MNLHDDGAVEFQVGRQQGGRGHHFAQHRAHCRRVVVAVLDFAPGVRNFHQLAAHGSVIENEFLQRVGADRGQGDGLNGIDAHYLSYFFELSLEQLAARNIAGGVALQALDIFFAERAHGLGRRADDQRIIGKFLVLRDQGAGADQASLADLRAIQDDGLDADQRAVADGAAVQHGLMADRHAFPDRHRIAQVGMHDGAFLDIAVGADGNAFVIAANRHAIPDRHILAQCDFADHVSGIGNVCRRVDAWIPHDAFPYRISHHPRPAHARASLGPGGGTQAVHGARVDGRGRVVPVRRRLPAGRLARHRARLARLRPDRAHCGRHVLVPRLPGRPRSFARSLRAGRIRQPARAQHGRQYCQPVRGRAAGTHPRADQPGRLRLAGIEARTGATPLRQVARRIEGTGHDARLRRSVSGGGAPAQDESAPAARARGLFGQTLVGAERCRRMGNPGRPGPQTHRAAAVPGRGNPGLLAPDYGAGAVGGGGRHEYVAMDGPERAGAHRSRSAPRAPAKCDGAHDAGRRPHAASRPAAVVGRNDRNIPGQRCVKRTCVRMLRRAAVQ
ncbi:unnamed protein product [Rhizophagus irregularis]|nr:unnamed protein product [Rhizophagus irregularis]